MAVWLVDWKVEKMVAWMAAMKVSMKAEMMVWPWVAILVDKMADLLAGRKAG